MEHPELTGQIIQEFRKGNSEAFASFFRLHYRPLCYFAVQMINDAGEAEDIVKDSFVKLWHKHGDFNSAQTIKAFLYVSTRNACINFLRHMQVKDTVGKEMAYLHESQGQDLILQQMIRLELMQEIYSEIEKLPQKRREVFKLAYIDGLKNEEIANQLNISIFTVKEQKAKALAALRMRFSNKELILFMLVCLKGFD